MCDLHIVKFETVIVEYSMSSLNFLTARFIPQVATSSWLKPKDAAKEKSFEKV